MSGIEFASAILGILAVGAKVTTCLFDVSQTLANTPEYIKTTLITVKETSLILKQLELYINQVHSVSDDIRSLLSIDHLSETLTGCVLTHSELEKHLDFIKRPEQDVSMFDRGKWLLREKEIKSVVIRLEGHKSTFTLILQILQCHSMRRAQETLDRLSKHMESNAAKDAILQAHLQQYKLNATQNEPVDSQSVYSVDLNNILPDTSGTATITSIDNPGSVLSEQAENTQITRRSLLKYENVLKSSWIYRRIDFSWSKTSILSRSRSERGMNPSILSKETWDTISNIAVYRLPIEAAGVYNSHRYEPTTFENPSGTLPTLEMETEGLPIVNSPQSNSKTKYTPPRSPTEIFAPTEKADKRERRPIYPLNLTFIFPPKLSDELEQLEFPNPHFVSQEGLFQVLAKTILDTGAILDTKNRDGKTSTLVLWGRTGYGKTETVLNFLATEFSPINTNLPHRIWVQASTEDQIVQAYSTLAKQMGLVSRDSTDQRAHTDSLYNWFETTHLRWLLILDNVPNLSTIFNFVPRRSSGTVIITTRDRPSPQNHNNTPGPTRSLRFEKIEGLNEKQAIMIVESYFRDKEADIENEAVKLAEKVGFVPIGLQAAIKYMQEQTTSLNVFNQEWTATEAFLSVCKVGHGYRGPTEGHHALANDLDTDQQLSNLWQEEFSLANVYRRPVALNNFGSRPRATISENCAAIYTWFDIKTINFRILSIILTLSPFKNLSPSPPFSQDEAAQYMFGEFLALSNHASNNHNVDKLAQISCAMAFSPEARTKSLDLVCSVILPSISTTIAERVEGIDFIDCVTILNERFTGFATDFEVSSAPLSFISALKDAAV
ncbi:hypothetical protein H072_116 [Dactylellina haptotyla CBS 200.50]|uniref:NB-ARC domain-containing protein n=1 Tax=Dactylellina haptotyla (strain CBS 200.50) TaxID=1284197 RepID=S8C1X1_DACHA|nr:hypothetical protein H072_116 [Dactylellina haptotyla CBS 200.50]